MTSFSPIRGRAAGLTGRRAERDVLDRLLDEVRGGQSRSLVVRGEPGVGKTALLGYVVERAPDFRVARATGVQSEMELAFAALHQLCAPMLDHLDRLPAPQRDALRVVFGISTGSVPDRFLVALAVLSLLSDLAEAQPLICLVDDEQWLDRASAQAFAFVARRLEAESVGFVFAARKPSDDVVGLSELVVEGLPDADARALLDSVFSGPLDTSIRNQIVAETRGNPLALLELPRGLTPAQLAGGFGLPDAVPLTGRIEETFRQRLTTLPVVTCRLLQLAAADPTGDPVLLWRAAERLGLSPDAMTPAVEADLIDLGARVRFRHPLVRSTVYQSASLHERQDAHRALAEVTDAQTDPDRRAWHRAQATSGFDETVAAELEHSAGRAQARGGLSAAAAFLQRAAMLTPEPARRAQRLLASATEKRNAGALDEALGLLVTVEAVPLNGLQAAEVQRLRGQIAFEQRRAGDAVRLLLNAARRLGPLDAALARETHLEALGAAIWTGNWDGPDGMREAAESALAGPPAAQPPRAVDVLLEALAVRLTEGYAAAAPLLTRACQLFVTPSLGPEEAGGRSWLARSNASGIVAPEMWDADTWHAMADRWVRLAREAGALVQSQFATVLLAWTHVVAGDLSTAALLIEEDRLIAEATGNPPVGYIPIILAAWRGQEREASQLIEATVQEASARGLGRIVCFTDYATSVLNIGLGRHHAARDAARRVFERDQIGYGPLVVPELAEAASRTGDAALLSACIEWLSERTRVTPTDWSLGIETRVRALASEGEAVDALHRESIEHLGRTRLRVELARSHLLYGEWLRRERRRVDARGHLRTAHEMLAAMGVDAFADRARRELQATGETVRKRTVETRETLTAQEAQIALLARKGMSNPEIGTRLFISPRTVQYHLRKVFTKLDITSRSQLDRVLPGQTTASEPL